MSAPDTAAIKRLIEAARDAAGHAYAPYSNYHVGAALLLDTGEIVSAANFENASYGMTLCAETVAIAKASSEGQLKQSIHIAELGIRAQLAQVMPLPRADGAVRS